MEKIISQKNYKPYMYICMFLAIFAVMFSINFILPIEKTIFISFSNINERSWTWCEILITIIATFYIFKIKKFTKIDFVVSILIGLIVEFAEYLQLVVTMLKKNFPISAIAFHWMVDFVRFTFELL